MEKELKGNANTKAKIAGCCLEILKNKNIDKITVKDVTSACGISRQTFYYHFQDIIAVYEYILQSKFEDVERRCIGSDNPKDAIRIVLETGLENRVLINQTYSMLSVQNMTTVIVDIIKRMMYNVMEKRVPDNLEHKRRDVDFMLDFYAYGLYSCMASKLASGGYDAGEFTDQLYKVMAGELKPLG